MSRIKNAILIAAGEGSRLRPVTLETPKPLVKVKGRRIIDTILDALFENGIENVYIAVGYKKEQFYELYGDDPRIHVITNPDYLKGNNITSMFYLREYLPESFVIEADILVKDPKILNPEITGSGYLASWRERITEWGLLVENGCIRECDIQPNRKGYQLWGISMWNKEDGTRLSQIIEEEYRKGNWNIYWDELALFQYKKEFALGIRKVVLDALIEIDTVEELAMLDDTYKKFL